MLGGISPTLLPSFLTFHQIVLPYKSRSLTFQLPDRLSCGRKIILIRIPRFWGAIIARDPHALSLAPLVQELSLLQWNIDIDFCQHKDRIPELFEEILNSVFAFQNLTTLKNAGMCYHARYHGITWQTCTTPVVAHISLPT